MDKARILHALLNGAVDPFIAALYYGKGSAPPAPDYIGAAKEQGAQNVETAKVQGRINNPNINTPYGSQTVTWAQHQTPDTAAYQKALDSYNATQGQGQGGQWVQDGGDGGGQHWVPGTAGPTGTAPTQDQFMTTTYDDQPTVNQTLNPQQQALFDQTQRIEGKLGNMAEGGLGRVDKAMGSNYDPSGLPGRAYSVQGGNYITSVPFERLNQGYDSGGDVQKGLDFSQSPKLPGVDDFSADRTKVEDALYSRLNPQFDRQENAMRSRLANQGITNGSEAYNNDVDSFNRAKNDARQQAILAGGNEQSRLFGLGLQARQQDVGERSTQGTFANSAQAQANAQNAAAAGFANQARQGEFSMGLQNAELNNSVGQQRFNEGMQNANLTNTGRQNQISEDLMLRQLPLNELNSLRTGVQIQNPQFQPYQGSNIQPAPIFNATQAQGQANQNLYSLGAAQNNQTMSTIGSIAGAVAMAY